MKKGRKKKRRERKRNGPLVLLGVQAVGPKVEIKSKIPPNIVGLPLEAVEGCI